MDQELRKRWFEMPIEMQISNIGSEVNRAINWKNKGDNKKKEGFCLKAIDYLSLSIEDVKNSHRVQELLFCIRELQDYFLGVNYYNTNDEMLRKYYNAFI